MTRNLVELRFSEPQQLLTAYETSLAHGVAHTAPRVDLALLEEVELRVRLGEARVHLDATVSRVTQGGVELVVSLDEAHHAELRRLGSLRRAPSARWRTLREDLRTGDYDAVRDSRPGASGVTQSRATSHAAGVFDSRPASHIDSSRDAATALLDLAAHGVLSSMQETTLQRALTDLVSIDPNTDGEAILGIAADAQRADLDAAYDGFVLRLTLVDYCGQFEPSTDTLLEQLMKHVDVAYAVLRQHRWPQDSHALSTTLPGIDDSPFRTNTGAGGVVGNIGDDAPAADTDTDAERRAVVHYHRALTQRDLGLPISALSEARIAASLQPNNAAYAALRDELRAFDERSRS